MHSELYEIVAVREAPDRLRLWLDRFEGNAPVTEARLEVAIGEETVAAEAEPDGTWRLVSPLLARAGCRWSWSSPSSAGRRAMTC